MDKHPVVQATSIDDRVDPPAVADADLPDTNAVMEEFSIVELEDRLEFFFWCNGDCKCGGSE